MFHSVAVQLYGNSEAHDVVRQKCMDYVLLAKDFFSNFIEHDKETIE